MSISVTCQACGSDFRVSEKYAGKRFACRNCRAPLVVPQPDELGLAELDDDRPTQDLRNRGPAPAPSSTVSTPAPRQAQPPIARAPQPDADPQPRPGEVAAICNGCGHRTLVAADLVGRRVRCKKCGQVFRVGEGANPDLGAFAATAPRRVAAPQPRAATAAPSSSRSAPQQPLRPPTTRPQTTASQPAAAQPTLASAAEPDLLDVLSAVDEAAQPALPPLRIPARPTARPFGPVLKPAKRRQWHASGTASNTGAIFGLVLLIAAILAAIAGGALYGLLGLVLVVGITTFVCRMVCFGTTLVQMMRYGAALMAAGVIVVTPVFCCGGVFVPLLFGPDSKIGGWAALGVIFLGEIIALFMALGNADEWKLGKIPGIWGAAWGTMILAAIASQVFGNSPAELAALRGDLKKLRPAPRASGGPGDSAGESTNKARQKPGSDDFPLSTSNPSTGSDSSDEPARTNPQTPSIGSQSEDPFDTPASPRPSPVASEKPSSRKPDGKARVPTEEIIAQALDDLATGDHWEQQDALRALKRLPPTQQRDEVSKALVAALGDSDLWTMKTEIIDALAVWGTAECVPALIEQLEDDRGRDGEAAMRALGKLKDPRGAQAVARKLTTRDARKAIAALRDMGPVAEDTSLAYLHHKDPQMRGEICVLLGEIGTAKSIPELKKRFGDEVKEVRAAARQAATAIESRANGSGGGAPERDPFRVESDPAESAPAPSTGPGNNDARPKALKPAPG